MKKIAIPALVTLAILALVVWTMVFLYNKSREVPVVYETEQPAVRDIVRKTVATGAIVPRQEIAIKPRISGVIDSLAVEPGNLVTKGAEIARIKVIPNMVNLNSAEARVREARLREEAAKREFERFQGLFDRKLVADAEYTAKKVEYELAAQELNAAQSNLQLIREGATRGSGKVQNVVTSTIEGMVLDVPVEEGVSVIETNNFNEGTTIATIANMQDLIFKGTVDESEVGKISNGMELSIRIGALGSERFDGNLEYIAPKGSDVNGAIQFEIRAAIKPRDDAFVRANYSATADIVLERRDKVLAIREALLFFDEGKPYVEVEVSPQKFTRREIETGLSDGIFIEITSGLSKDDKLKAPNRPAEGNPGGGRGRRRRSG